MFGDQPNLVLEILQLHIQLSILFLCATVERLSINIINPTT
jgi:hypothetical protein